MKKKIFTAWITMLLIVSLTYSAIAQTAIAVDDTTIIRLDPKDNLYTTDTANVGTKFNVTIWVDNVVNLAAVQVYLDFNDAVINTTRWFEPKNDPQYVFYGRTTSALPTPPNDMNYGHVGPNKGKVLTAISLFPPDPPYFTGSGKLCIFEFKVTAVPVDPGTLTSTLHIDTAETYLLDGDGNEILCTKEDGYYEIEKSGVPPTYTWLTITTTAGGTTDPIPGVYKYTQGTPASVQANPTSGYAFDHWELDGENVGATNPITVAMNVNHTLHAQFTQLPPTNFELRITSTIGGSTNPSPGTHEYSQGSAVSVKATPDAGYLFNHWDLDGEDIGAANPVTVTMDADHNLDAVFAPIVVPPVEKAFDVQWSNYSLDPKYPFWGGMFHDGTYPVWKNFTVLYYGNDALIYVSVKYPETTPNFKPSRYEIKTFPYPQKWTINVNLADRLIEFTAVGDSSGLTKGMFAIVSIEFTEGPTEEDCTTGHEFAVSVSEGDPLGQTFYLKEYIDKTAPTVAITFPDAPSPGGQSFSFIKRGGSIWVLMPNCTNRNIGWLWVNGTASDMCSGINRVEIWINGTYMGDATLSPPATSTPKKVTWWWRVDPTKDPSFWKTESWYYVVARAYDNSVNDEKYAPGRGKLPKTNSAETKKWFFWIGVEGPVVTVCFDHTPLDWVPGNGRVDVWGETGFYPNHEAGIWMENELYAYSRQLTTVTTDNFGRFYVTINHLPEVPRKPTAADRWVIKAVQVKNTVTLQGADSFAIIPWITYENTLGQDDPTTWRTTKTGNVFDTFTVYGHGFLPSRQTAWDPYSTVYVRVVYTDVAPLEAWENRMVFNGTGQFNWDNMDWYPRLSETVLAEVRTDSNGYWSAQITIPQSYGGLHAIYAYEYKLVTDVGMPGPRSTYDLVKSGWPECTEVEKEEQAVIFDVWPTIEISPSTAITDQYVTITGEGLPLPRYYKLWKNGKPIVTERDQCLVLDFGPYEQWVFENKRIRSNELDLAWVMETWYPFSYYTPDMAEHLESPVWKGKLTSITVDYSTEWKLQFHIGSKFLKVPMLPAGRYEVMVYYFDKNSEDYVYDHDATTTTEVLKDPLHVNVDVGKIHFPSEIVNVFAQVDVDGKAADPTVLTLELYKGETLVQTLSYSKVSMGSYVATFTCPTEIGDYFIKASATKIYETFTLYGTAISGFTINPTISEINPKLVELEGKIVTLQTDMGQVKFDVEAINGTVVGIKGDVANIKTNVGTLQADVDAIDGKVVSIEGKIATVETSLGVVQTDVASIDGKVTSIESSMATIETDVGTFETSLSSIDAAIASLEGDVVKINTAVGDLEVTLKSLNGMVTLENNVATIKTDLGEMKGKVLSLEGKVATIQTDVGTIKTPIDEIRGSAGLQPVTIGLSLLAALAAIAAAVLILRKVYIK